MANKTTVAIIINKQGEFLLQKKTTDYEWFPGKWGFFGGGIEEGETPKEAIKRELLEESGIEFSNMEFFKTEKHLIKGVDFEETIFIVEFNQSLTDIRLNEGAGFAFFDKEELNSIDLFPGAKKLIEEYIDESN